MSAKKDGGGVDHLSRNRMMIIERSVAAGAMGLLPVPILDEVLSGAVRSELLRRVAAARNVGVDERAISVLSRAPANDVLDQASRAAFGLATVRRAFVKIAAMLHVARRVDEVAGTFAIATLFDHYCARHHVGPGVDGKHAERLRDTIAGAISDARAGLARRGFGRAARGAGQLLLAAPRAVARLASGSERASAELVEPSPRPAPREGNPVSRAIVRVTRPLGLVGETWIEELVSAFDRRWELAGG